MTTTTKLFVTAISAALLAHFYINNKKEVIAPTPPQEISAIEFKLKHPEFNYIFFQEATKQ